MFFFLPEVYLTTNYLIRTDERAGRICKEALVETISPGYEIPSQTEEALRLFVTVTTELVRLGILQI